MTAGRLLRIGLDISAALARPSGLSFYIDQMLAGLAEVDRANAYFLCAAFWKEPGRLEKLPLPRALNFQVAYKRVPQRLLLAADAAGAGIQERWFRRLGLDIFHGLGNMALPLKSIPTVVTIHHVASISDRATAWEKFYLGPLTDRSALKADRVITDSEFSRREAIRHWNLDPARVVTVGAGRPLPNFRPREGPRPQAQLPYILHVGGINEHKNIPTLIRAFHLWIARDSQRLERLLLVGRPGRDSERVAGLIRELGLSGRVELFSACSDSELLRLYQNAAMVVVPSFIEGFGFPVLEAMACGVPVLASTAGSLPEVAGSAAVLFDPLDVEGLSRAMEKVGTDPALAEDLRQRGLKQTEKFSWTEVARRTVAVYASLRK